MKIILDLLKSTKIKYILLIILGLFFIFNPENIFADGENGATPTTTAAGAEKTTDQKIVDGLKFMGSLVKAVGVIVGILTGLVAMLMNPEFYTGNIFGMETYLHQLWIFISNIVYLVFAIFLIVIAFMNILGKGGDKFELKQALPKLIVGVLFVPFSWFIVQFMLSLSSVLTVSVLSLPMDTFRAQFDVNGSDPENILNKYVCTSYDFSTLNLSFDQKGLEGKSTYWNQCSDGNIGERKLLKEIIYGEEGSTDIGIFSVINLYTYGIFNIGELDRIQVDQITKETLTDGATIIFGLVFIMIFVVMYFLLMVALFLALFVRIIWMWIYSIFSPVFGLMYFTGGAGESAPKEFSFKEFIHLCLTPVYVSAALSFGFLFILITSQSLNSKSPAAGAGAGIYKLVNCVDNTDATKAKICTLKVGDFEFKFSGLLPNGNVEDSGKWDGMLGAVGNGIGVIIIQVFGLVAMWMAVMAALSKSSITKSVIEPIAQFGKSMGGIVMKGPQYLPIIPGPNGKMVSAAGLGAAGQQVQTAFQSKFTGEGADIGRDIAKFFNLEKGTIAPDISRVLAKYKGMNISTTSNGSLVRDFSKELASAAKNLDSLKNGTRDDRSNFIAGLKEAGIEDANGNLLRSIQEGDPDKFAKALYDAVMNSSMPNKVTFMEGFGGEGKGTLEGLKTSNFATGKSASPSDGKNGSQISGDEYKQLKGTKINAGRGDGLKITVTEESKPDEKIVLVVGNSRNDAGEKYEIQVRQSIETADTISGLGPDLSKLVKSFKDQQILANENQAKGFFEGIGVSNSNASKLAKELFGSTSSETNEEETPPTE